MRGFKKFSKKKFLEWGGSLVSCTFCERTFACRFNAKFCPYCGKRHRIFPYNSEDINFFDRKEEKTYFCEEEED